MKNQEIEALFARWRAGDSEAWAQLKPHIMLTLRRAKPALNIPQAHLSTIRSLLCLRLDLADETELRTYPGERFWEFYASLTRRYLVELLREGIYADQSPTNPTPPLVAS